MPPVYQPEVAARAVAYAADHPGRKQYWVGGSTVATLAAQKVAAPLLDRYLARAGYASQQTDQPDRPDRPGRAGNLWRPLDQPPGTDRGAHGAFSGQARRRSPQPWLSRHAGAVAAGAARALTAAGLAAAGARTRGR